MIVFLNGQFLPEAEARVSIFDRGFLYGDGLFETLRVSNGRPFRWAQHCERLRQGADYLRLQLPVSEAELAGVAAKLIELNHMPECVLRVALSRGVGPVGYSIKGASIPTLAMSLRPALELASTHSPRWRLLTSSLRLLPGDSLAAFKTANKLRQVLARAEAEAAGADEALLLSTDGNLAETAGGNLFWLCGETLCTPPLEAGVLPGITRAVVMELGGKLGLPVCETLAPSRELFAADGAFATLSTFGVVPVTALDGRQLSESPWTAEIGAAYAHLVRRETGC